MGRVNAVVGVGTMDRTTIRRMVDRGLLFFTSFHPFMRCLSVSWTVLSFVLLSHYALSCPILSYIVLFCFSVRCAENALFSYLSCLYLYLCFLLSPSYSALDSTRLTRLVSPLPTFVTPTHRLTHSPLTSHLAPRTSSLSPTQCSSKRSHAHTHTLFPIHTYYLYLPAHLLTYLLARLLTYLLNLLNLSSFTRQYFIDLFRSNWSRLDLILSSPALIFASTFGLPICLRVFVLSVPDFRFVCLGSFERFLSSTLTSTSTLIAYHGPSPSLCSCRCCIHYYCSVVALWFRSSPLRRSWSLEAEQNNTA